jgi:2-alkyl-3-oxoalkanoate reductase
VINQLTALPERLNFRDPHLYDATNRLRGEGTRKLLAAARAVGVRRLACQSIAFMYAPVGGIVKSEDDPVMTDAPSPFGSGLRTLREMERLVLEADGLVLRYGFFYGPGTYYGRDGSSTADVRKRRLPVVGKGTGVTSFVHIDDAADATVAAVERGPSGVYNVTDDEPAPMGEWVPVFAEAAGAKPPRRVPVWLARLVGGKAVAAFALELRGASNAKAKRELGWTPAHPSWRTGFAESLGG